MLGRDGSHPSLPPHWSKLVMRPPQPQKAGRSRLLHAWKVRRPRWCAHGRSSKACALVSSTTYLLTVTNKQQPPQGRPRPEQWQVSWSPGNLSLSPQAGIFRVQRGFIFPPTEEVRNQKCFKAHGLREPSYTAATRTPWGVGPALKQPPAN